MPEFRNERPPTAPPRLLDRLRDAIRSRHYSPRTAEAYAFWTRKFIIFHGKRHPDAMGAAEVKAFLTYLAITRKVASSTQNQALAALVFLYGQVLGRELQVTDLIRAKKPVRVPVTLSPAEVARILHYLRGLPYLAVVFMYGSGLRLMECLQLRVQDLDFAQGQVIVRQGKGQKDRRTLLPAKAVPVLREYLAELQHRHNLELSAGGGAVVVPEAVSRRFPGAATDWAWQWVFPASRLKPHAGGAGGRPHLHKTAIQRAFSLAVLRSGVMKAASCHSLRHSFARELVEASYDIRTIQELMGHKDVATTMIYTHVLNRGGRTIRSPLDAISAFVPYSR